MSGPWEEPEGAYGGPPPTVRPAMPSPLHAPPLHAPPLYAPPPHGWPAHGPMGTAGSPGPPPGWGPPAGPRRPGQVTAAAVLAFVQAGVVTLVSLYLLVVGSALSAVAGDPTVVDAFGDSGLPTEAIATGIVQLLAAALLVAAGVRLLLRRTPAAGWLAVAACAVQVGLAVYWPVRLSSLASDGDAAWLTLAVTFAAMPVVAALLLLLPPGRTWFRPPGTGRPAVP